MHAGCAGRPGTTHCDRHGDKCRREQAPALQTLARGSLALAQTNLFFVSVVGFRQVTSKYFHSLGPFPPEITLYEVKPLNPNKTMKTILSVLHASPLLRSMLHGRSLALASAAAALLTHAALAQTWQTVDDFQYLGQ